MSRTNVFATRSSGERAVEEGGEEVVGLAQGFALGGAQALYSVYERGEFLLEGRQR